MNIDFDKNIYNEVEVFDFTGKKMFAEIYQTEKSLSVNFQDLSSGVYVVVLSNSTFYKVLLVKKIN